MEITYNLILFLFGLSLLIFGSDYLIHASAKLASLFRLTPLFIGLVFIAFGTSLPEAVVSIVAGIKGHKEVALGNILGSCIANIGLVLGICAFLFPLRIEKGIFRREVPLLLLCTFFVYLLGADLVLGRVDGFLLLIFFFFSLFLLYKGAKEDFSLSQISGFKFKQVFERLNSRAMVLFFALFSLFLVIGGANLMLKAGLRLAEEFRISAWVIGISVFAISTSLPELAASLSAGFRGFPSIGVGNVIGSNIFNILFILGVVSLIKPVNIQAGIWRFDFPVLLLFSLLLSVFMRTGYKISRAEGLLMFLGYLVFILLLIRK